MSQVDPDAVKQFLQEEVDEAGESVAPGYESPADVVTTYENLKKEGEQTLKDLAESADSIEEGRSKLFEPDKASLAHLSSWVHDNKADLKVEVEEQEKALYLKSLLNDTILELPIKLDIGITLVFRALTNYDFEVVFNALQKDSEEGKITGPAQYASRVQQCAVAMQLLKFGDKHMDYVTFKAPYPTVNKASDILRKYVQNDMSNWAWPKWQAAVTGLRVFETKLAICNENIRSGGFWQPVGTA